MESHESFSIEEYKALRAEILYLVRQSYLFEAAIFVGIGAIYSWLFSDIKREFNEMIWWLPFGISALGAIRELGVRIRLLQISGYLRNIETSFVSKTTGGWENYLYSVRKASPAILLGFSNFLIWSCIVAVTFLVGIGCFR